MNAPLAFSDVLDRLPTQDDLPYSSEEPMDSNWHVLQFTLLIELLRLHWASRTHYFCGGNMFLYYSPNHLKNEDILGPDFFVVLDVPPGQRKSWVMWQEGKGPDVVIEYLSTSTRDRDLTIKRHSYEKNVKVHEYICYDPEELTLIGWRLAGGNYEPIEPDEFGRLWIERLGLWIGTWVGEYQSYNECYARFFSDDGQLVLTGTEQAAVATELAQLETERAQRETERAQRADEMAQRETERAQRETERAQRADEIARRETERAQREAAASKVKDDEIARVLRENTAKDDEIARLRAMLEQRSQE